MAEEIQEVNAEELPAKQTGQITITDLLPLAQPIMEFISKSQLEQRKQEFDYNLKEIEIQSRQNKYIIIGLFLISAVVLLISGYLYIQNRDSSATNLIQMVVALGGAAFGGYGWAKNNSSNKNVQK
jgi:hypothetical protein